jgi:malonate-semialdehyde dehydrogenase (acetylating)/methylmalonate-semialdehyde dehydrogenase
MTKTTGSVEHVAFARNYVGGHWVDPSGSTTAGVQPGRPGVRVAEVGVSTAADLVAAVDVRGRPSLPWRNTGRRGERARPLFRFKHLMEAQRSRSLPNWSRLTMARPLKMHAGEVRRAIENVEVACGIPSLMMGYGLEDGSGAGVDQRAIRQPLGVFAAESCRSTSR